MAQCPGCHKENKQLNFYCPHCAKIFYCSQVCQRRNRVQHKKSCQLHTKKKEKEKVLYGHGNGIIVESIACLDALIQRVQSYIEEHYDDVEEEEDTRINDILFVGYLDPFTPRYSQSLCVKTSRVHERGLFAKQDIPSNALVTFFPAHRVLSNLHVYTVNVDMDDQTRYSNLIQHYSIEIGNEEEDKRLIGDPKLDKEPCLWGHFVNDAACNVFHGVSVEDLKEWSAFYTRYNIHILCGLANENCCFKRDKLGLVMAVVTLREIKKGQELRASYPISHWLRVEYGNFYASKYPYLDEHEERLNLILKNEI
jgi:hypothetical protein